MLDIRFIRQNPEKVQQNAEEKGYKNVSVSNLLKKDEEKKNLQQEVDVLRQERNELAGAAKSQRPTPEAIAQGKELKTKLASLEDGLRLLEKEIEDALRSIPNMMLEDVPLGGEEDGKEVKRYGENKVGAVDHLDFATARDWVDFEKGAAVAGSKFYYLKGDLALLENAITQYALQVLLDKKFTFLTVPHMVNSKTAQGAGFSPRSSKESNEYFIEGEDLMLIGTAEAPLTGYHTGEIINAEKLPLFYVGLSPCYRREAGTYGKHTRGLFRVHQFNKLEMYVFCAPEDSQEIHEKLLKIEEEIWQNLKIPYRVINIAAGDLGAPAAKKYDIEYWSPVDEAYRELTSCSNCTDFQARSLNIRLRKKDDTTQNVHTLNGTAVSLARSLVTIIENYQNADGSLTVPEVLRPFMQGRDKI